MLVFITPHVIRDPSDFAEISKTKIEQRNRFIESNYGKRQQRSIYDTIAAHRADLLTYVGPGSTAPSSSAGTAPPAAGGSSSAGSSPRAPVITAPPIGTGPQAALGSSSPTYVAEGSKAKRAPAGEGSTKASSTKAPAKPSKVSEQDLLY